MIRWETLTMPAASMGEENPLADIDNIEYIHAGYEVTDRVSQAERDRIGKGMIHTILPYTIQDNFNRTRQTRAFRAAVLENEYLKATFLPELGARLWSLYDKEHQKELLYVNPVFQPANLAIRNAWFSGGVEFNEGIKGHNPLTCDPYFARIARTAEGEEVLQLYELERVRGCVFGIQAYLPRGSRVLYLKDTIENPSEADTWSYWWSNIAVPETKGTRVIVPTNRSFLSTYDDGHYILDKVDIPQYEGVDASYPVNLKRCLDFFYEIPRESDDRWVCAVDESGVGLAQLSTREMVGRKLFLWGQSTGGKNWGNFLSDGSGSYIEIQAGLAYTQLEHLPMKGNTVWEWTEGYTGIACDPYTAHSPDWEKAKAEAGKQIRSNLGAQGIDDALRHAVPTEFDSYEVLMCGSGFGALEEVQRGAKLSRYYDFYPDSMQEKQAPWQSLLQNGYLPEPDPSDYPVSYVIGEGWEKALKDSLTDPRADHWYTYYQMGVVAYQLKKSEEAQSYFEKSLSKRENPWSHRNLAMLCLKQGKTAEAAREMRRALALCPDCMNLYTDAMRCFYKNGDYGEMEQCYENAPQKVQARGRIRLLLAMAYLKEARYDDAATIINADFQMDDIREGEISLSHLWFDLYREITRQAHPKATEATIEKLLRQTYPLPAHLDFRMHGENRA